MGDQQRLLPRSDVPGDGGKPAHEAYYTPPALVSAVYDRLPDMQGLSVCDPSLGAGAWLLEAAARDAAPPIWKVRMVSCVPGSPIDCAATTPTASP